MQWPVVQRRGIEVRAIRPNDRVHFGVEANLVEQGKDAQRTEQLTGKHRPKVDAPLQTVGEPELQRERRYDFTGQNAMDGMAHGSLGQRVDRDRGLTVLQSAPVVEQFLLMQLSPSFD